MSLFKSREWWSVNLNETESYDSQCLLISTIGKDRYQSILLGNHNGLFRIYGPSSGIAESGEITGYRPSDLLMESQFPAPVLQMCTGMLVSGCQDKNLAVLHPKLLSVYTITRKEGGGSGLDDQIVLAAAYQHQLRHSAYSMIVGPFGGGHGRDFICVQSLDGSLFFYEQESFSFRVCLPNFLLPSPFAYVEKIDCFLFLNSSMILDCYSYENLSSASRNSGDNTKSGPKYWSYHIGEGILDIKVVSAGACHIVILTERNLYDIDDTGRMIFTKRLEYRPMALHAYVTAESKKLLIIVAADNRLLNIYEGTRLRWATTIDQVPVAVDRIILSNLYGGIVLLTEDGYLQCIYLGTHPSTYVLPPMREEEVNLPEVETELKRLHSEISERDRSAPADADWLGVDVSVDGKPFDGDNGRMCRISVDVFNQTPINRIQVSFVVDPPLTTAWRSSTISCCDKTAVECFAYLGGGGAVADLNVRTYVSFVNGSGMPFVVEKRGRLPLGLVLEKTPPVKEAKYKLTVMTNKPVCPLNVIFGEFTDGSDSSPNVIGLRYLNSESAVTVLTAKTTQRYRIQSDRMESVGLVLSALVERLRKYFQNSSDLIISYDGALPMQAYFEAIQRYHDLLLRRKRTREELSKRTCQYRTIQKKVLINLKDVTPKPISNLNDILKDTYEMIVQSVTDNEDVEEELKLARYSINSLSSLLVTLTGLMEITAEDLEYLKTLFSGNVYDSDDQGWLEVQLAAASFFLRTTLAKSSRDQHKPTDIALDPVSNASKVLKTFSAVIDRVTKGTHLLERSEFETEKELVITVPSGKDLPEVPDIGIIPEGSKLADLDAAVPADVAAVARSRREKRLIKQERVDSLGTVSGEGSDSGAPVASGDIPGEEKPSAELEKKSSFDSIEDDAIWDVKVKEMRI